jgi:hypothetical protein
LRWYMKVSCSNIIQCFWKMLVLTHKSMNLSHVSWSRKIILCGYGVKRRPQLLIKGIVVGFSVRNN